MTSGEKAYQLIVKFDDIVSASMCCDEILEEITCKTVLEYYDHERIRYWQSVKEEIEKP